MSMDTELIIAFSVFVFFVVIVIYSTFLQKRAVRKQGQALTTIDESIALQRESISLQRELADLLRETNRLIELVVKNEKSDSN